MNLYQIVDVDGNAVTSAMGYTEAQRFMQKNSMNRGEYTIELYMPVKREVAADAMNLEQALTIIINYIALDATLSGESVNLNRVTFLLSELSYGRKHTGPTWSHCVPRDIIRTAAEITESAHSASALVKLAGK